MMERQTDGYTDTQTDNYWKNDMSPHVDNNNSVEISCISNLNIFLHNISIYTIVCSRRFASTEVAGMRFWASTSIREANKPMLDARPLC